MSQRPRSEVLSDAISATEELIKLTEAKVVMLRKLLAALKRERDGA